MIRAGARAKSHPASSEGGAEVGRRKQLRRRPFNRGVDRRDDLIQYHAERGEVYAVFTHATGRRPHDEPCYFCGERGYQGKQPERRSLAIHHIDHDHANNDIANLAVTHRQCHIDYHKAAQFACDELGCDYVNGSSQFWRHQQSTGHQGKTLVPRVAKSQR